MTIESQRETVARIIYSSKFANPDNPRVPPFEQATERTQEHLLKAADNVIEYLSAEIQRTVDHFREGLKNTPSDSVQFTANSNRALGADCARDAINSKMDYGKLDALEKFPAGYSKVEELAVRLCAHDCAVDPEHVLETWSTTGDNGWREPVWRTRAREMEIAYKVLSA